MVENKWDMVPFWSLFKRIPKRTGYATEELLSVYREFGVVKKKDRSDNNNRPGESLDDYQLVQKGDLVLNKMKAWQGSLGISKYDGIVSPAYFVYNHISNNNEVYLHYLLRSKQMVSYYASHSKGIRPSQWDLQPEYLEVMNLPLPPLETQQRIADYLDRETAQIDDNVSNLNAYIDLLKQRRQVLITDAVTGHVDSNGNRVEGGQRWDWAPAGVVMKERSEKSNNHDEHLTPSQKYGVVSQKEYMEITGNRVVLNLSGQDNMKHVEPGDFIIHLRSFQGGIELSEIKGKVSNAYTVLSPTQHCNKNFYKWFMKSSFLIDNLVTLTDQLRDGQSINYSRFSRLSLPLPSLDEQQRIADFLDKETDEIDALIEDSTRLRDLLLKRRQVLITEVVTGKKEV